jgi:hypothetical protein
MASNPTILPVFNLTYIQYNVLKGRRAREVGVATG